MNFDLKTPCAQCPFRKDIKSYLRYGRVVEILSSIFRLDQAFPCHKTIEHDEDSGEGIVKAESQHCAGAMILLENYGRANQIMRIAERVGMYDRRKLKMDSPVFKTKSQMLKSHRGSK